MAIEITVGISNKHVHLSQADVEKLFGEGYQLTKFKDLKQVGQFAANEKVEVIGPKKSLGSLRILGPARKQTQVELAATDARTAGIKAPVRLSGNLAGSGACKLVGPCGEIELQEGVIIAQRHVHMGTEAAKACGLYGKDNVTVIVGGDRGLVFENVALRVSDDSCTEMHVDTDEGNAAGLVQDQAVLVF